MEPGWRGLNVFLQDNQISTWNEKSKLGQGSQVLCDMEADHLGGSINKKLCPLIRERSAA